MITQSQALVHEKATITPWVAASIASATDQEALAQLARTLTFADSTKGTWRTHRNTYLRFCLLMGFDTMPLHQEHLLQYVPFRARILQVPTIKSYLNIVSLLHKEFGFRNPLDDNWLLKSLLTGIKWVQGPPPNQNLPITITMLHQIHSRFNPSSSFDASFWATFLVSFFGLFRKSHLLPMSAKHFDPAKQFTKADFHFHSWGILLKVCWSRTIQFQCQVRIPLMKIPDSPSCPVQAASWAFRFTTEVPGVCSQAFTWLNQSTLQIRECSPTGLLLASLEVFSKRLTSTWQPKTAGHSFWCGGPHSCLPIWSSPWAPQSLGGLAIQFCSPVSHYSPRHSITIFAKQFSPPNLPHYSISTWVWRVFFSVR